MVNTSIVKQAVKKHLELFQTTPALFRAPGRINLIGEHTDYNEGFVLPAAIDRAMYFSISRNNRMTHRFYSLDYEEYQEHPVLDGTHKASGWALYLLGVMDQFRKEGVALSGVDCVFGGDIPVGAGLSSSAALECGLAFGLNELWETGIPKAQLTRMAQLAEHESVGVLCGIMDQYASMFGKKGHVFKLDCRTIEHEYFPLNTHNFKIALVDTGVKHELASSEYNQRRQECEAGVTLLRDKGYPVNFLRDVSLTSLDKHQADFDPVVYKRCRYVVEENLRVEKACQALSDNDPARFGELMYASHQGLKDEYAVSCHELDLLVDATRNMEFVYGSRMMGGGFGGCTINLLEANAAQLFEEKISAFYHRNVGRKPSIYFVGIEAGATAVNPV